MATVFSKIIAGEIPSFKIYEDEWTYAFLTKDAINIGHTLVVPKVDVDYFIDVPEPFYSKVFENSGSVKKIVSPTVIHKQILWDSEEKTSYDITNGYYKSRS